MNALAHAHFVLGLFENHELTQDEKDHLIVGSFIPDIHLSGLIQAQKTHTCGLDFFHSLKNPLHKYFALGMITHGEEPWGLDHYVHKENGYIQQKHHLIVPLAKKYKKHIGKVDKETVHNLIELSVDNLVAEKNPSIVPQVLTAFKNPKIKSAVTAFSNFFGFSERKNLKILSLLKNRYILNFFRNLSSPETTSQNWINLTFYLKLQEGKRLPFRERLKKLTKFSFYNLKRKISNKHIARLFHEINSHLRNDIHDFLSQTQKELTKLKNELAKDLGSQKG